MACENWTGLLQWSEVNKHVLTAVLPFVYRDGDYVRVTKETMPDGRIRLSDDEGATQMRSPWAELNLLPDCLLPLGVSWERGEAYKLLPGNTPQDWIDLAAHDVAFVSRMMELLPPLAKG